MDLEILFSGFVIGMSALGVTVLATRMEHRTTYLPLAGFFLFNGLAEISFLVGEVEAAGLWLYLKQFMSIVFLPIILTLPILLWFYIRGLTSDIKYTYSRSDLWHFVPVILGIGVMVLVLSLPIETVDQILHGDRSPSTTHEYIAFVPAALLGIFSSFQIGFYVFLTLRRLVQYRARLKDIFASTENREMGWIIGVIGFLTLYWALNFIDLIVGGFFNAAEMSVLVDGILETGLMLILGTWGLRQIPGFAGAYTDEPPD